MSAQKSPLRDRLLSNSPDPIKSSIIRDSGMGWISPNSNTGSNSSGSSGSITSPLRIAKRDSPRSLPHPPVARRTSASFRHVRTNNLVSKSPFKSQIPTPSATPVRQVSFPSPRRVSGEKRPRPSSIHYQAEDENERPFALKRERKQSKTFQGLIQKEPVTKSPFKLPTLDTEEVTSPPPPLLHLIPSAPSSSLPLAALSATPTSSSGVSPGRSSLVSRRMHGPRLSNGVQNRRQRRKTVTWDENCDVVEISADEHETDGEDNAENHMGVDDEEGDDDPFFRGNQPSQAARTSEEYSHDSNDVSTEHLSLELDPDASISGLVEEMFASSTGKALDSSSPLPDRDEHTFTDVVTSTPPRQVDGHHVPFDLDTEDGIPLGRSHHAARFLQHQRECYSSPKPSPPPFSYVSAHSSPQQLINGQAFNLPTQPSPYGPPATPPRRRTTASPNLSVAHSPNAVVDTTATSSAVRTPEVDSDIGPSHLATPPIGRSTHAERQQLAQEESCPDVAMLPGSPSPSKPMKNHNNPQLHNNEGLIPQFRIDVASSGMSLPDLSLDYYLMTSLDRPSINFIPRSHFTGMFDIGPSSHPEDDFIANSSQDISQASSDEEDLGEPEPSFAVDRHSEHHSPTRPPHDDSSSEVLEGNEFFEQPSEMFDQEIDSSSDGNRFLMPVSTTQPKDDMVTEKDTTSLLTAMTDISTETAVVECAERKTLTGHNVAQHEDDPIEGGGQLHFDFGSELHYDLNGKDQTRAPLDNTREEETLSLQSGSSVKVGELDVDMDMRSALDRLMDDVAGPHLADSIVTEEGNSYEILLPRRSDPRTRTMERAHTDSELLHNNFLSRNMSVSSGSSIPPPPPPPKDNIRNREQMILERRREARLVEHEEFASPKAHEDQKLLGVGRPTRRRSMSTGDADLVGRDSKNMRDILLDVVGVDETEVQDEQFRHSIEQELKKMAAAPAKSKMASLLFLW
ncbi:hypothetical protein H0H93_016202 [Arthromyces matolae]|nr:hypothetical protein H0H93_016202 [Arthromyces matolae]